MRQVKIFDTTLRDAEQIPGAALNADQKMELALQLARLNVDVIEAGFPASSPGDLKAVGAIAERIGNVTITALARCVRSDIDAAWEAVRNAELPRIHVFIGTSDHHISGILRKSREEVLAMAEESVAYAREHCSDVEFSPMDATRTDYDYLCEIVRRAVLAGATTINIPDTVGYAVPGAFNELITNLRQDVCGDEAITLSVHCHNDLGLATANSLVAVSAGAGQVECCVNGLGERAGNAALEEVAMAIRTRREYYNADTRINSQQLVRTSRMVAALMGIPVQANKAIVGANAFAHSSGIHQDGILKQRSTFEIIRPEDVGLTEHRFVLTARSGRNALNHRLQELGYTVDDIEPIYQRFIEVADRKKEVLDADLEAIMGERLRSVEETYQLLSMEALSSTEQTPHARVKMLIAGEEKTAEATGDGPVDALFRAIEKCVGLAMKLEDFGVRAVTGGKEAMGEVSVRVRSDDKIVNAVSTATDIVRASAKAFVSAANMLALQIQSE